MAGKLEIAKFHAILYLHHTIISMRLSADVSCGLFVARENNQSLMKEKFLAVLKKTINWLQLKYEKWSPNGEENIKAYNSLSPIANADRENYYSNALNWALNNRKENDIKNIAITGPYGSGKSSILKTFQKRYNGNGLHFLNISLATFKEGIAEAKPPFPPKEDVLRLIELSILQQIFYHEEDHKIPDSRFKKIKNHKKKNVVWNTIGVFFFILAIGFLWMPELLERLTKTKFLPFTIEALHYLSLAVTIIGLLTIVYKSIWIISSIRISKLKIQNAEFEINEKINTSILNQHIDEILYFFEVRPYNVVVIEDLDRFEQTEIFTKLREINLLINNSKKVKREVVFIYAVRDDMFKDKERTKFFDFIIPIIPVINSSNSKEMLIDKKKTNNYDISDDLLDNISLFIDDMRLLHNITNEFFMYYQNLNKTLNQDKLLSILVYKNIFPNDFTLLSNNGGVLFQAIHNKRNYVNSEILDIEENISLLKDQIKSFESLKIKDLKELRSIYIFKYVQKLNTTPSFYIDYKSYRGEELLEDEVFEYIVCGKASYDDLSIYNSNPNLYRKKSSSISFTFQEIEKEVDPNFTYSERKALIEEWNQNKVEILKNKLVGLDEKKAQVKGFKIKELLYKGHLKLNIPDVQQSNLVNVLLRHGYIDEDYLDYISIFYEGSITKSDHQFLLNVKSQTGSDFDYKLNKTDKLIDKINLIDFEGEYILNFELVDFVLQSSKCREKREYIFKQLKNESKISIEFIDGFVKNGVNVKQFFKGLCKSWINIWSFIEVESNFTKEKKNQYFKLIIEFAEVSDIRKISKKSSLLKFLHEKENDFINSIQNKEKLKEIIEALDIKFNALDEEMVPNEILSFVYENNHYAINPKMVEVIIKARGNFNRVYFDTKNFSSVLNSGCDILIKYVFENISKYVNDVYVQIDFNNNEDESALVTMLNSEDLSMEDKIQVVQKVETKITDLSLIDSFEIDNILLKESKVQPTWDNVFGHYKNSEDKFSNLLIHFINQAENASELSKNLILKDIDGEDKYETFTISLIKTEKIVNPSYDLIIKSIPQSLKQLNFEGISKEKAELLLINRIVEFNVENLNSIKSVYESLHVKFIEYSKAYFLKNVSDYELDRNDLLMLLKSSVLTTEEKNLILEIVDESIVNGVGVLNKIGELIIENSSFRISSSILENLLTNQYLSPTLRVKAFNAKFSSIEENFVREFLNYLPEPYSDIAIKGKRPLLGNNPHNRDFASILGSMNFISKHTILEKGIRISTYRKK